MWWGFLLGDAGAQPLPQPRDLRARDEFLCSIGASLPFTYRPQCQLSVICWRPGLGPDSPGLHGVALGECAGLAGPQVLCCCRLARAQCPPPGVWPCCESDPHCPVTTECSPRASPWPPCSSWDIRAAEGTVTWVPVPAPLGLVFSPMSLPPSVHLVMRAGLGGGARASRGRGGH